MEVDPYFYTQLRGKARISHSINACLSGKIDKVGSLVRVLLGTLSGRCRRNISKI